MRHEHFQNMFHPVFSENGRCLYKCIDVINISIAHKFWLHDLSLLEAFQELTKNEYSKLIHTQAQRSISYLGSIA